MPNTTTNYNLTKPLETERYDVEVFNDNADIIDTQMKANADNIGTNASDISSLASRVTINEGNISTNTSDISSLASRVTTNEGDLLKAYPHDSATGTVATFTDGADDVPCLDVVCDIEPMQDLNGYDNPWAGGAGKNKAKPYSYSTTAPNGVTFTYNGDGSVTLDGTATANQAVPSVSVAVQNNFTFTLSSGTYIPSISASDVNYEVYDTTTTTLLSSGSAFTLTEETTVLFRVGAVNGQTYSNLKVYMQLEQGSTATSYTPYSNICPISGWDEVNVTVADDVDNPTISNVYTIDLNGTYYGGTLDVTSGLLTVDREIIDLGTLSWVYDATTYSFPFFYTYGTIDASTADEAATEIICDSYKTAGTSTVFNEDDYTIRYISSTQKIRIRDSRYSSADELTTALSGVYLVYPLATSTSYQLTATEVRTLLGTNNIWHDANGDTTVSYPADPTLYIQKNLESLDDWTTVEFDLDDFTYDEDSGVTYLRTEAPSGYEIEEIRGYIVLNKTEVDSSTTNIALDMSTSSYSTSLLKTLMTMSLSTVLKGLALTIHSNINLDLTYVESVYNYATASNALNWDSSPTMTQTAGRSKPLDASTLETTSFTLKTDVPYSNISEFYGKLQYRMTPSS